MVASTKSFAESRASSGSAIDRVASWLPSRPGGYRLFVQTGYEGRIPVSVLADSPSELRLKIPPSVRMATAQPVDFVSGRRRIAGSVQRITEVGDGTSCVEIAFLWNSMDTREHAVTADHEVILSC